MASIVEPNRLKELREQKGLTSTEVAKLAGVDVSLISKWESGIRDPSAKHLKWLTKFYGLKSIKELYIRV